MVTSVFISIMLDVVMSFSSVKNLGNTCKYLYYSLISWRNFFSCNGGKLETTEGYICLFIVSSVLELKQSLAN